jgi:hypothetical protein
VGLAFSGGGIRSATFNLGIIQGLARLGLLPRFDYLSVNSGGGYIGGWLGAWIRRRGVANVARELAGDACRDDEGAAAGSGAGAAESSSGHEQKGAVEEGQQVEAGPVRFLRRFSNYLTPKVGVFTADTWTVVATYTRNLLLNLVVLVLLLAVILLSPRLLLLYSRRFSGVEAPTLLVLAVVFLGLAIFWIGLSLAQIFPQKARDWPWYAHQGWVQILVVAPLFVSAWFAALWLWFGKAGALAVGREEGGLSLARWSGEVVPGYAASGLAGPDLEVVAWAVFAAVLYGGLWVVTGLADTLIRKVKGLPRPPHGGRVWTAVILGAPVAGAVGGALLWVLTLISRSLEQVQASLGFEGHWNLLHINVWKAPAIVLVFVLTAYVHTGLMGRAFPEALREWWSRLGSWMLIYAVTWLGFFALALYGPILLVILGGVAASGLSLGWLASTFAGVMVGKDTEPMEAGEEKKPPLWRRIVVAAAPQIFIVGLLALVALGLHAVLQPDRTASGGIVEADADPAPAARPLYEPEAAGETPGEEGAAVAAVATAPVCDYFWPPRGTVSSREVFHCHSRLLWEGTTARSVLGLLGALAVLAMILSWRVDINEFSMHLFYRNRLIRAFLGASNEGRRPQPFTGFDPGRRRPPLPARADPGLRRPVSDPQRHPEPGGGQGAGLAGAQGGLLGLHPAREGFDVYAGEDDKRLDRHGYRPTEGYRQTDEGLTLGTAMAISGAAASPNMGAGSTPAMAFLLTVFNVRLGWWLGNPRHRRTWFRMGPLVGVFALLSELFGHTDEESRYVYLSDGGHFDNLALYELIRRRCRFILATDAGADPEFSFADLGNSIRKCCTDFGVEIDVDPATVRKVAETGKSEWHCAVGTIRYDTVDPGAPPGVLVYLKASLTGDEPADAQAYSSAHRLYPHEPTADQWFSESQFESYRKLGEHVALKVLGAAGARPDRLAWAALGDGLKQAWNVEEPKGT